MTTAEKTNRETFGQGLSSDNSAIEIGESSGGSRTKVRSAQAKKTVVNAVPGGVATSVVSLKKPLTFFVLAYLMQGVSQHIGVINQPLQYFLMSSEKLSAGDVAFWMSLLMVPWIIKPVYALLSDFKPIARYRRRSYLLLVCAIAGFAFFSVPYLSGAATIVPVLVLAGIGIAFANVVLNALTIESARQSESNRHMWSTQALSFYTANIACVALGGYLCQEFSAGEAIGHAAVIAGLMPLLFLYVVLYAVRETHCEKVVTDWKLVLADVKSCFRAPAFLAIGLYMCFFNFCPAFNVPLYFYESNVLNFNQFVIGQLNACSSFGMLCGALLFKVLFEKRLTTKQQLIGTAVLSSCANLAYLLLGRDPVVASCIHFLSGIASMAAILAMYEAATKVCPRRMEATAFAALVAAYNISGQLGQISGGYLYGAFGSQLMPLVWLSAMTTLFCVPLAIFVVKKET